MSDSVLSGLPPTGGGGGPARPPGPALPTSDEPGRQLLDELRGGGYVDDDPPGSPR